MLIDTLRKKTQAQFTLCLWISVVSAVVAAAFGLLSLDGEHSQVCAPSFFFALFVSQLLVASACYQMKVTRALLAEIDALRSRISHPGDVTGDRPSTPGGPTA